eukprot:3192863-Rhodomonas_salina.1
MPLPGTRGAIDLAESNFCQIFTDHLMYAAKTHFPSENYMKYGGSPVLFLYALRDYRNYENCIKLALEEIKLKLGQTPYIIGDSIWWYPSVEKYDWSGWSKVNVSAVTAYNLYDGGQPSRMGTSFAWNSAQLFHDVVTAAWARRMMVVPTVVPSTFSPSTSSTSSSSTWFPFGRFRVLPGSSTSTVLSIRCALFSTKHGIPYACAVHWFVLMYAATECSVPTERMVLPVCAYASATQCPVLTQRMVLPERRGSRASAAVEAEPMVQIDTTALAFAMRYPVLTQTVSTTLLHGRYALSGTGIAYAATHALQTLRY